MKRWVLVLALAALAAGCAHFAPKPLSPAQTAANLEGRTLDAPPLHSFLETNLHRALPEWPLRSWDFETLTLAAFYYQPSLEVARADWGLARAGIRTAAGRLNPSVTALPAIERGVPGAYSPWMPAVSFDIPIETAGKRPRRIELAQHLSESARLAIAATAWQVRSQLRAGVVAVTAAAQREALLERQLAVQEQIVAAMEQQHQAGALSLAEVLPARLQLQQWRLSLNQARQQRAEARASVAAALGVPLAALEDVRLDFDLAQAPASTNELTSAEARQRALLGRADVLAALSDYAAAQAALRLEIAKQYPDLHLGPGYLWNQGNAGDSEWELGLTVELPILNRNQGPIAEAEARRTATAARFTALQASVIAALDRALAGYRVAAQSVAEAETLLATQRRQQESAQQQFRAGATDRLSVLAAQVEVAASELTLLDSRTRFQDALGALEDAVQSPLVLPEALVRGTEQPP